MDEIKLTKKCSKCGEIKELDEFRLTTKNGNPHYKADCKKCHCLRTQLRFDQNKEKNKDFIVPEDFHKECSRCHVDKNQGEFRRNPSRKDGLMAACTKCKNKSGHQGKLLLKENNKNRSIEEIYNNYPTRTKVCPKCKTDKSIYDYGRDNSAKHGLRSHCKDCILKWKEDNHEQILATCSRIYYERYRDDPIKKKQAADRTRKRRQTDVQFKIRSNLSGRINKAINGRKSAFTMELLGCSMEFFMQHLESQFEDWMSLENYGKPKYEGQRVWEIEHITPCEYYNLEDPAQQRECFNWKNLRPLCSRENKQKNDWMEIDGKRVRARDVKKKNPTDKSEVSLEEC